MTGGLVGKKIKTFFKNPARTIIFAYLITMLAGAVLLVFPISHKNGEWYDFGNALFTSVSSVSVTGMMLGDPASIFSVFGQIVILLLIQMGGIGCMGSVMFLLFVLRRRINLTERIALEDTIDSRPAKADVMRTFKQLLIYVFTVEIIGALVLMCSFIPYYGGKGAFYSIFISVSAFCNAGIDIVNMSAHAGNFFVLGVVMVLVTLGGFGFIVARDILLRLFKGKRLSLHTKIVLVVSGVLIVVGTVIFLSLEWKNAYATKNAGEKLLSALFQSVSARTAGFTTIPQGALTSASQVFTNILSFIGASPASTGGGIKVTTLLTLAVIIGGFMRGKTSAAFFKNTIPESMVKKILATVFVALSTVALSVFLILAFESGGDGKIFNAGNVIYDTVNAFTTTGLSLGVAANGSGLTKCVLALTMVVGRIGVMTMGTAILKSHKGGGQVRYTEAKIIIG